METQTRDLASRRWIGRLVRVGLVVLAVGLAGSWISTRVSRKTQNFHVVSAPVTDNTLGAGDLRIYNRDSTVDLILRGHQVLAGLSPKTVAKVQNEMQQSATKDTSGIGGIIASTVKNAVASNIGIHAAYSVSDIRDMRYDNGQLIIERASGGQIRLFGDKRGVTEHEDKMFAPEDAERFIAAVRERRAQLESGSRSVIVKPLVSPRP